jgi:hypothetical protein
MNFAIEPVAKVWDEVMPLCRLHWQETEGYRAGQEFDPRRDVYQLYNERELFLFFTAREEGKLVGYAGIYVVPSMHSKVMTASEDTWFLLPEQRRGWNIIHFWRFIQDELVRRGVVEIWANGKLANRAGRILEFLGFKPVATRYCANLLKGVKRDVHSRSASRA